MPHERFQCQRNVGGCGARRYAGRTFVNDGFDQSTSWNSGALLAPFGVASLYRLLHRITCTLFLLLFFIS